MSTPLDPSPILSKTFLLSTSAVFCSRTNFTMRCCSLSVLTLLALVLVASADLPDNEYDVTVIHQKTACPTIYCPWNCERYVDRNGCLFCGQCTPKTTCPPIKCPNLPYFSCVTRVGRDGCATCKCRAKPKTICPSTPMCSAGCNIQTDGNGCQRCACPLVAPTRCNEPANAPCRRADCWRERGADGCHHCVCPDDVYSCPEVKCDSKRNCVHTVDTVTGCATGCQCQPSDNDTNVKPSKVNNNRLPIPMAGLKTHLRG